ncbi:MAG: hydrogenase maturation protease [Bacteroidales bacterium]|nr:hydrogenase maturation protease [Bacteroidales bacterium]
MPGDLDILLSAKDKKILFVGVGNLLKQDDGVGPYITSRIVASDNIDALTVETGLENYIGKINSLNPDILVIVDCMNLNSRAGTYKLLALNQIQDLTFNTHNISLRHLSEFFEMPVFILGIQPEKIAFGENISYLVKNEANKIINQINSGR